VHVEPADGGGSSIAVTAVDGAGGAIIGTPTGAPVDAATAARRRPAFTKSIAHTNPHIMLPAVRAYLQQPDARRPMLHKLHRLEPPGPVDYAGAGRPSKGACSPAWTQ